MQSSSVRATPATIQIVQAGSLLNFIGVRGMCQICSISASKTERIPNSIAGIAAAALVRIPHEQNTINFDS